MYLARCATLDRDIHTEATADYSASLAAAGVELWHSASSCGVIGEAWRGAQPTTDRPGNERSWHVHLESVGTRTSIASAARRESRLCSTGHTRSPQRLDLDAMPFR